MSSNTLHHGYTLSKLNTEAKYQRTWRSFERYGRNGESGAGKHSQAATVAYNRAERKASRLQLSRYDGRPPVSDHHSQWPGTPWIHPDNYIID